MSYAGDAKDDGRWITIHPNGSANGKHVKVDSDGRVVAGNPHLVAALQSKDKSEVEFLDDIGEFTAPTDDDLGVILGTFEPPTEDDLTKLLEEEDPAAVESPAPKQEQFDGFKLAAKITYEKALSVVKNVFHKTALDTISVNESNLLKSFKKGKSVAERETYIRHVGAYLDAFASRFPGSPLLESVKKHCVLACGGPKSKHIGGEFRYFLNSDKFPESVIGIEIDREKKWPNETEENFHKKKEKNAYKVGETVPYNTSHYYKYSDVPYHTLIHEIAHAFYHQPGNKKKWQAVAIEAAHKEHFYSNDIGKYASKNFNEYHSEVVAMMAHPDYVQGTLPECIERYVYEDVFGVKQDEWKKKETQT